MESNIAEMAKLMIEEGHIKDEEIMPLLKLGVLKMLGGKETEKDIFKPIGHANRNIVQGEPIYHSDLKNNNFHKFNK